MWLCNTKRKKYLAVITLFAMQNNQSDLINFKIKNSSSETFLNMNSVFKVEHPDNTESQSLLDFRIQISPTGKIYTSFNRKPTTKDLFVHFKSALPLSAKTNYIRKEIKRIQYSCCEDKDKITHTAHFINTLKINDYLTSISRHLNNNKSRKLHTPSYTCFLNLPHFSEIITKEIRRAIHKGALDIQLSHYRSSLRQYLAKKKNNNTVTTCTLANCPIRDPNICQKAYTFVWIA